MSTGAAPERLVVNFHGIGEPWPGIPDDEVRYWCPSQEWPALAEALARVRDEGRVTLRITFDDGNLSDIEQAMPVLLEHGLTATFFACAGRIGHDHYLGEADLEYLRASGMGIGSHGWDHVDLRRLDESSLSRETSDSRVRLAEASAGPVDEFAIPFGSYDRRVLRSLRDYREVHTSDGGHAAARSWLTPRSSYVRGWQPADITAMVETAALGERLRRRARTFAKSLRWGPR